MEPLSDDPDKMAQLASIVPGDEKVKQQVEKKLNAVRLIRILHHFDIKLINCISVFKDLVY